MLRSWRTDPGSYFEGCLEAQHELYRLTHRALVRKTYPMVKFSGGHNVQARAIQEGLPDYVGVLFGGRAVLMEAKTWKARDCHTHRERMHQAIQLQQWAQMGAAAGYLVGWRWHDQFDIRWYPMSGLDIRSDQHGEYLVFLRNEGVPVQSFDWLAVAMERD